MVVVVHQGHLMPTFLLDFLEADEAALIRRLLVPGTQAVVHGHAAKTSQVGVPS